MIKVYTTALCGAEEITHNTNDVVRELSTSSTATITWIDQFGVASSLDTDCPLIQAYYKRDDVASTTAIVNLAKTESLTLYNQDMAGKYTIQMKFYTIAKNSGWVTYNHIVCGTETISAASASPIRYELHNHGEEYRVYTYDELKGYFTQTVGDTSSSECFNFLNLELFTDEATTVPVSGDTLAMFYFDNNGVTEAISNRDQLSLTVKLLGVYFDMEQVLYLKATTKGGQSAVV